MTKKAAGSSIFVKKLPHGNQQDSRECLCRDDS